MKTMNVSLQRPIKFQQMEFLIEAIKTHLSFYSDKEPQLLRVTQESFQVLVNDNINSEDQELLKESIEIEFPEVQISFTDKF